jgi:hypothetical protein
MGALTGWTLLPQALIALLVAFLLNQRSNFNEATDVFTAIADIDWGSDLSFEEKVGLRCHFSR